MQTRSAWQIQADVIFAIFLQDMRQRFSHYTVGNFWFIIEPMLMVGLFIVMFGLRGRGEFGLAEPPVFIMAGILPYMVLFMTLFRGVISAPTQARKYLLFRQVEVLDIILVKAFSQAAIFFVLLVAFMIVFAWIGLSPLPHRPLEVLVWCMVFWIIGLGFGLVLMYVSSFAPEVGALLGVISMPLKILSATFFPMTIVPEPYQTWLSYIPLVHINEFIREYWFEFYESPVADAPYALSWAAGFLVWGMMLYRLKWSKMMMHR